jgi:pimeloyl-ACP methyl ester carboxylesterase
MLFLTRPAKLCSSFETVSAPQPKFQAVRQHRPTKVKMPETLQLRIHGEASLPALIYLPGLHGDWTLAGGLLEALDGRVRFVEITYPRTLAWSLNDYAAAIETALAQNGITSGWLLGESFGSQPLWALVGHVSSQAAADKSNPNHENSPSGSSPHQSAKKEFQIDGVILAGGFVKHPMRWAVRLAERLIGRMSNALFIWVIFSYAKIARFRYRNSKATLARIDEFVARRTELDRRAAQHRLHLIAGFDPRQIARETKLPIFGLSGILDPIVPWPFVRRWLKRNCPTLREYKIITSADHNVLATAPIQAARQVLEWMNKP